MKKYVSRGLYCALFVGGITLLGSTAANAADTTGEDGLLSGDQVISSITAPITASGNALSVVGDSQANTAAVAAAPASTPAAPPVTSGSDGVASGNQVVPDVAAPVIASGNAISVIGDSQTNQAVAEAPVAVPATSPAPAEAPAAPTTDGEDSIGGGNQIVPVVALPVNVGGNAISVIGDSESNGSQSTTGGGTGSGAGTGTSGGSVTDGADSVAGGNQIVPVVALPVNVGGNTISVIGDSQSNDSQSTTGGGTGSGTGTGSVTDGADSVAGGNQIVPVVDLPVNVGGNAISVIGDSESNDSADGGTSPTESTDGTGPDETTDGVLSGNTDVNMSATLTTVQGVLPSAAGSVTIAASGPATVADQGSLAFTGPTGNPAGVLGGLSALLAGLGLLMAGRRVARS